MNNSHESCQLSLTEIAAIMSLAGKKNMVGFKPKTAEKLTAEAMWNACCSLMKDGMMTQIDGKFRMCRELVEVMKPICQARAVLILTPGSDLYAQKLYYAAEQVVSMQSAVYGGYLLKAMDEADLPQEIAEHLELVFSEQQPSAEDLPPEITVQLGDSRKNLAQGSLMLLEQLNAETGERSAWIRIVEQGVFKWLQWTERGKLCCEALTRERLEKLLNLLLRGEL